MKKKHSIKDIAAALQVSSTTVSFVINGKAREKKISKEVTERVLKYAREIGYKPNQLAKSLRTGKTNILVFMVEDISNHFFSKIGRIIEDKAYEKGYRVLFCSNENSDQKSRELIEMFVERQVDGFIISPSPGIQGHIKMLVEQKIPVVLFDRYFPELDVNSVTIDNKGASFTGTEHLIANGYKEIGFITTDVDQSQMNDRLKGYLQVLEEHGLQERVLKLPFKDSSKGGKQLLREFLRKHSQLDAVFFATNYLTRLGLEVLQQPGWGRRHFGIITFDDNELFQIHTPSVTAVAQPMVQMGEELMGIMLKLLERNGSKQVHKVRLEASLQVRDSSRPSLK